MAVSIELDEIKMTYPDGTEALKGVTLHLEGGMFGLLGPNGAGKSTLIRIMATLLAPTGGNGKIGPYSLERDRKEIRRLVGYLPQEFAAYPQLTCREFLTYKAKLSGRIDRKEFRGKVDEVLEFVGLHDVQNRRIKKLSGGMRRRLGIAQAILGPPELLIVDEPTVGLDPEERIRFRNLISDVVGKNTVILSTHIVGDVSSACNTLAILDQGRISFCGSPSQLIQKADGRTWEAVCTDPELALLDRECSVVTMVTEGDRIRARFVGDSSPLSHAQPAQPTLEDAYVYFMDLGNRKRERQTE